MSCSCFILKLKSSDILVVFKMFCITLYILWVISKSFICTVVSEIFKISFDEPTYNIIHVSDINYLFVAITILSGYRAVYPHRVRERENVFFLRLYLLC